MALMNGGQGLGLLMLSTRINPPGRTNDSSRSKFPPSTSIKSMSMGSFNRAIVLGASSLNHCHQVLYLDPFEKHKQPDRGVSILD